MRAGVVGVLREDDIGVSTQERTCQYELWIEHKGRPRSMLRIRTICRSARFHLPVGLDHQVGTGIRLAPLPVLRLRH